MSEQHVEAFASVEQTLAAVEEHLQVFKSASLESVVADLSPLEKAKVQVSLGTWVSTVCTLPFQPAAPWDDALIQLLLLLSL